MYEIDILKFLMYIKPPGLQFYYNVYCGACVAGKLQFCYLFDIFYDLLKTVNLLVLPTCYGTIMNYLIVID